MLYPELTVEEALMFSANWRLPRHFTEKQKRAELEKTLEILDLTWIRNARIGNFARRGISGGEKKQVNINVVMGSDRTHYCQK